MNLLTVEELKAKISEWAVMRGGEGTIKTGHKYKTNVK